MAEGRRRFPIEILVEKGRGARFAGIKGGFLGADGSRLGASELAGSTLENHENEKKCLGGRDLQRVTSRL